MKIYVACLASYNNGVLHGRWIDAESDVDCMRDQVNAMLRESKFPNVTVTCPECEGAGKPYGFGDGICEECKGKGRVPSAEEFAIHDYDGLPSSFGEFTGLDTIAEYVELAEEFDHIRDVDMAAIVSDFGSVETTREQLNDNFVSIYDSFRDYADESAEDMISSHDIPDDHFLVRYFDYDAYAHDLQMDMHCIDAPSGVAVFHA